MFFSQINSYLKQGGTFAYFLRIYWAKMRGVGGGLTFARKETCIDAGLLAPLGAHAEGQTLPASIAFQREPTSQPPDTCA